MASHCQRFAHQTLREHVFDNPLGFARAVANPRQAERVLGLVWDRAGQEIAAGERLPGTGLAARVVRVDPYVAIHVEPPFPRGAGDACAIVVVGRGDGEQSFDNVRYYVVEPQVDDASRAVRFVLASHATRDDDANPVGEAPVVAGELVSHCAELAAGRRPSRRSLEVRAVPLWYWWHVFRGADVIALFHQTPEHAAWNVVHANPTLLLPEIVDAAERALGPSAALAGLRQMQLSLRSSNYLVPFQLLLANVLANEAGGSPRVNQQRALAVVDEIRAHGGGGAEVDALGAALREKISEATQVVVDPTWSTLFLEDNELPGYQRGDDRRDGPPADRLYETHGGLRGGHREWMGADTAPVHRIIDGRWLFPSAKTASAFVQAAAAREKLPAGTATALGDSTHAWGGTTATGERMQVLMIRIGRVVARLAVTEGPKAARIFQPLGPQHLVPIGEAIVKRARWSLSRYWLAIGRANEAVSTFVQTNPRAQQQLFTTYPILALPELVMALSAQTATAEALIAAQGKLKASWQQYRDVMRALVLALLDEERGEPRVNADAALALVIAHRRVDSDYSWAKLENECRARL